MVDRCWQVPEEPLQGSRVVGVEGRGALRAEFHRRLLQPVGIAAGEDDIRTLSPGASSCLEPDACAAADHDDRLSGQFRFCLPHCPPHSDRLALSAPIGLRCRGGPRSRYGRAGSSATYSSPCTGPMKAPLCRQSAGVLSFAHWLLLASSSRRVSRSSMSLTAMELVADWSATESASRWVSAWGSGWRSGSATESG